MTNWPNIQEYKNFGIKFFGDSGHNLLDSDKRIESENAINNQSIDSLENLISQRVGTPESKTVRCVIKKDFEESFKKLDRGDGANHEPPHPKAVVVSSISSIDQSALDKIRLENHLKWTEQKEQEYLQKKETERIARQKKKEEDLRMEKIKRQRERDREQKIREWQEQKAREKEEKNRKKLVMRALEKELKQVTPKVDKERLIEEWVKLKNKQKQIEAEKRSECLKKEQASRELRQSLAELSYRQWKERVKGRIMTLPKNGYQIFGPKPVPVVKEDWNHNFTNNSPRHSPTILRSSRSNNCVNFQPPIKEIEDLSEDIFYLKELKNLDFSFPSLKTVKSGFDLYHGSKFYPNAQNEMPLKELQMEKVNINSNKNKGFKEKKENQIFSSIKRGESVREPKKNPSVLSECDEILIDKNSVPNDYLSSFRYFSLEQGDQNFSSTAQIKNVIKSMNGCPKAELADRNKIDLFLNKDSSSENKKSLVKKKKKNIKYNSATDNIKEVGIKNSSDVQEKKSYSSKRCFFQNHVKHSSVSSLNEEVFNKNSVIKTTAENKGCRRSRSCDKSAKKNSNDNEEGKKCSSSKSMIKIQKSNSEARKTLEVSKTTSLSSETRKKKRKFTFNNCKKNDDKKINESDIKLNKKKKKKTNLFSKSMPFNGSPYFSKKKKFEIGKKPGKKKLKKEEDK